MPSASPKAHPTQRARRHWTTFFPSASGDANWSARSGSLDSEPDLQFTQGVSMSVMTYIDAINTALREEMESDPRVFLIGEDIGKMGGAFKATKGLLDEFGSERVIDSPLAEGIIISSSIGAALAGMR